MNAAPRLANLAIFGLIRPRSGAGALVTAAARTLAQIARLQPRLPVPLPDLAERMMQPSSVLVAGMLEMRRDLALARSALWALDRRPGLARALARAPRRQSWPPEAVAT